MATTTVAVDFDGTIHNQEDREPGYRMGKPFPGAKWALDVLRTAGVRIVIHTLRARPSETVDGVRWDNSAQHVKDWLDYFDIPYDEVTALKPIADAYVDDKAVPFTGDWVHTLAEVRGMLTAARER